MRRSPIDLSRRLLLAAFCLLACGESFVPPPDGIDVAGERYFAELDDEEAEEVCTWWRSHFEYVNDGRGIQCPSFYLPSGGLDLCVDTRSFYGPDSDCHIRVQRFYDCIALMPNYCGPITSLPDPCRLPETCNSRLEP